VYNNISLTNKNLSNVDTITATNLSGTIKTATINTTDTATNSISIAANLNLPTYNITASNITASRIDILSYGLSSINGFSGLSSLSSIVSYGLSSLGASGSFGISSLSSIVSYGLSSLGASGSFGISSLSSIVSYGLSSIYSPLGISSLSSIVSYGLSSLRSPLGISSLSSIVSYGLSSLYSPLGISSLSSIVSYGLSSLYSPLGVSSLSSIVAYGLSSLYSPTGISSLSSIVSYGLSSLRSPLGISSLSSIVSYGLSSVYSPLGVSSLSSIVSYGLSSLHSPLGISSLSSIVSYGLSSISLALTSYSTTIRNAFTTSRLVVDNNINAGGTISGTSFSGDIITANINTNNVPKNISVQGNLIFDQGSSYNISNLDNISIRSISATNPSEAIIKIYNNLDLSGNDIKSVRNIDAINIKANRIDIVSYGLSSIILSSLTTATVGPIHLQNKGGIGFSTLNSAPAKADTITNAFAKVDNWVYNNIVGQPPAPLKNTNTVGINNTSYTGTSLHATFDPPFQFRAAFAPIWLPSISGINVSIYDTNKNNIFNGNIDNPSLLPRGKSNFAGFYFDGSNTTNYTNIRYPYTDNNTNISDLYYVPVGLLFTNPNLARPYTVKLYYSNYSGDSNYNTLDISWTNYNLTIAPTGATLIPTDVPDSASGFIDLG